MKKKESSHESTRNIRIYQKAISQNIDVKEYSDMYAERFKNVLKQIKIQTQLFHLEQLRHFPKFEFLLIKPFQSIIYWYKNIQKMFNMKN